MTTTMTVQDAAFEIQDALRDEFTYLQPANQKRFDPVTVGCAIGMFILGAIANGVKEGIEEGIKDEVKEPAKKATQSVIRVIKERLKASIDRVFQSETSVDSLREQEEVVNTQVKAAQDTLAQNPPMIDRSELEKAIAEAVRSALEEKGLPTSAGERVQHVIESKVLVIVMNQ